MRADALPPEVERELAAIDDALAGRPVDPDLADLATLARDLRDERADVDAAFARELDGRVTAGFPRKPGRLARWRPAMPALAFATCALLALVVSVSVINNATTGDDDIAGGGGGGGGASVAAPTVADQESAGAGRAASEPDQLAGDSVGIPPTPASGSPRSDRRRERKVERSASLTLVAPPREIDDVANEIVRVTDALGGFVVSSSVESSTEGDAGGTFELRVPSARLQQALAQLSRIADVRERRQATQDITAESVSARERLADARAERKSLLKRLENATTDAEVAAIRAQLRDVSFRIRTARADLARVNNRAQFSTVVVALTADPAAADEDEDGAWSPGDALDDALRVLEVAVGVALVSLAVLLPLALLVTAGLVARGVGRRRRRERALDAI